MGVEPERIVKVYISYRGEPPVMHEITERVRDIFIQRMNARGSGTLYNEKMQPLTYVSSQEV